MKSVLTKATSIPKAVKQKVYERDNGMCIICGKPGMPNSHYVPRSHGGLGIEENIVTMCATCHHEYDNGGKREEYGEKTKAYLMSKYPNWKNIRLVFEKYR